MLCSHLVAQDPSAHSLPGVLPGHQLSATVTSTGPQEQRVKAEQMLLFKSFPVLKDTETSPREERAGVG